MILHEIRKLNSLKTVPSGVANYRNLPFDGRATWDSRVRLPRKENAHGVATNVYLRKTSEKPKRCGLQTLSVKGLGVLFTHGEGIRTSHVHYKGRQPLTKCVISCLRFVLFSLFYVFMSFYAICIFYLFVVDKGVSLTSTCPPLRWGNQTYVVLWELNVG